MNENELEKHKQKLKMLIIPMMIHQLFIIIPSIVVESIFESITIPFKVFTDEEYLEELIKKLQNE